MQLYVNELMVKKLSTFGAVIVVMLIYYRVSIRHTQEVILNCLACAPTTVIL